MKPVDLLRIVALCFFVAPLVASAAGESKAVRKEIGNRIIEVDTEYSKEITKSIVRDCSGATPVAVMVAVETVIRSLIPDDVEKHLKFRTSFNDLLGGGSKVVIGSHEVIGHLKPIHYEVRFAIASESKSDRFYISSIASSLLDSSKSQTERKEGVCGAWKEINSN